MDYDVFYYDTREATVHGDAQSLLRQYDISSGALYKISINLRKMGVPEEQVLATERLVQEEILKPLQKDFTAEIEVLEKQCAGLEPPKSSKPVQLTFQIQFPDANDLLELLLDFNRLLVLTHTLWHARKLPHPEYLRLTEQYRNRLKEGEKRIAVIAREAIQLARKQKEDAEVEAGIAAMAAEAGSTEAPQDTTKASGRRGRKAADTVAPALDTKEEGQEKGPENPLMASAEERAISPFEQIQ